MRTVSVSHSSRTRLHWAIARIANDFGMHFELPLAPVIHERRESRSCDRAGFAGVSLLKLDMLMRPACWFCR